MNIGSRQISNVLQNGAPVTSQVGAYNTYVGARYVPIFDGDWDATKQYEPLVIVTNGGDSYTSKQYVPAGTPVTNETFWAHTGNWNGQLESLRQEVINNTISINELLGRIGNYNIINVLDIGLKGDGVTDNYTVWYNYAKENIGTPCIFYFPAGTYNFSNGLILTDNQYAIGVGKSTVIHLSVQTTEYGTAIQVMGSNSGISNLKVSYASQYTQMGTGSNMGGIGITGINIQKWFETQQYEYIDFSDIFIDKIWCDGAYCLQAETVENQKGSNIHYSNIFCKNGCVSVQDNDGKIDNVYIDNVDCSLLRIISEINITNIKVNNVTCNFIRISADNAEVSNITLIDNPNSYCMNLMDYLITCSTHKFIKINGIYVDSKRTTPVMYLYGIASQNEGYVIVKNGYINTPNSTAGLSVNKTTALIDNVIGDITYENYNGIIRDSTLTPTGNQQKVINNSLIKFSQLIEVESVTLDVNVIDIYGNIAVITGSTKSAYNSGDTLALLPDMYSPPDTTYLYGICTNGSESGVTQVHGKNLSLNISNTAGTTVNFNIVIGMQFKNFIN